MDAVVAFIANGEATKPVEPGERALDDRRSQQCRGRRGDHDVVANRSHGRPAGRPAVGAAARGVRERRASPRPRRRGG